MFRMDSYTVDGAVAAQHRGRRMRRAAMCAKGTLGAALLANISTTYEAFYLIIDMTESGLGKPLRRSRVPRRPRRNPSPS